jgi:hypothetical protein
MNKFRIIALSRPNYVRLLVTFRTIQRLPFLTRIETLPGHQDQGIHVESELPCQALEQRIARVNNCRQE